MEKINFTKQDKQLFSKCGYCNEDIEQIYRLRYRVHNYYGKEKPFEEACNSFGREKILSAIGRSAFHSSGSINENWGVESNLFK